MSVAAGSIPFSTLEEAFGPSSLGIIVVEGLPEKFRELRREALTNSSRLAGLDQHELGEFTLLLSLKMFQLVRMFFLFRSFCVWEPISRI